MEAGEAQARAVQMSSEKWSTVATVGLYLAENLIFASLACISVVYFAPSAAGSGIPELMTYFNNAYIEPGYLSFNTFVAKVCCHGPAENWWRLSSLSRAAILLSEVENTKHAITS